MTPLSERTHLRRHGSPSGAGTLLPQVVQTPSRFGALPEPWDTEPGRRLGCPGTQPTYEGTPNLEGPRFDGSF